jgi:hypothetical protein
MTPNWRNNSHYVPSCSFALPSCPCVQFAVTKMETLTLGFPVSAPKSTAEGGLDLLYQLKAMAPPCGGMQLWGTVFRGSLRIAAPKAHKSGPKAGGGIRRFDAAS